MRIKTRLVLSTAVPTFVLLVALLVTLLAMRHMTETAETLINKDMQTLSSIQELYSQGLQCGQAVRNILINPSDKKAFNNYKKAVTSFEGELAKYDALIVGHAKDSSDLDIVKEEWSKDNKLRDSIVSLALQGDSEKAKEILVKQETPQWRVLKAKLLELKTYKWQYITSQKATFAKDQRLAQIIALILAMVGLAIATSIIIFIVKSIMKGLNQAIAVANRIAGGDLRTNRVKQSRDEIGRLMEAMYSMGDNLRELIGNVSAASTSIASASNQLHATAEQIATAAEEVASQTSTVATASEEISSTSSNIAANCLKAAETAHQTSESASLGAAIVKETILGMNKIAERVRQTANSIDMLGNRSEQIGEIIGTIEDIADQTNLLALNAAIEAARAGDQGRGFAVVADEVRSLAERTTKATKEISVMIKAIQSETREAVNIMEEGVREVEKGAVSSNKSGDSLQGIVEYIGEVNLQISQIATAAEQQTATINEIDRNIHEVTKVVHQSASGAEDTSSAAAQLAEQAQQLMMLVDTFKVA